MNIKILSTIDLTGFDYHLYKYQIIINKKIIYFLSIMKILCKWKNFIGNKEF